LYYFALKYQLVYVYVSAYESGGNLWPVIYDQVTSGMLLFQVTMFGLLTLKKAMIPGICIVPLVPLTILVRIYCRGWLKRYATNLPLDRLEGKRLEDSIPSASSAGTLKRSGTDRDEENEAERMAWKSFFYNKPERDQYVNPALIEPLPEMWLIPEMTSIRDMKLDWSLLGGRAPKTITTSAENLV
jgi:hypothetical protein